MTAVNQVAPVQF